MVLCIIALVVFGVLGIFSASHRSLAKESFRCVFRMIKLKPCDTGFDQRIKSKITAKLLKRNQTMARFTYKYFNALSIIFVVLFFVSMAYSGYVAYNLISFGTCDPHSTTCIFTPDETGGCGGDECQEDCNCEDDGCEAPDFAGCDGNCTCNDMVCR